MLSQSFDTLKEKLEMEPLPADSPFQVNSLYVVSSKYVHLQPNDSDLIRFLKPGKFDVEKALILLNEASVSIFLFS